MGKPKLPVPPKAQLETVYRDMGGLTACAQVYGVSRETFRSWMRQTDIPVRPAGNNLYGSQPGGAPPLERPSLRKDSACVQFRANKLGKWDVYVDGVETLRNVRESELDIGDEMLQPLWLKLGFRLEFVVPKDMPERDEF